MAVKATGYKQNDRLRAAGEKIEYTKENIDEYIKCMNDPIYFIRNYCYIVTLDKGVTLFDLYPCQEDKIKLMEEERRIILMEGRQQGKTATTVAYMLWYVLFQEHKTILIMANKLDSAKGVLRRLKTMYEYLPTWIQSGILAWNKTNIELENGSYIEVFATTGDAGRSRSANIIYVDEAAHVPNNVAEEFFTSVHPILSSGKTTKMILSSTPNGYNFFWEMWDKAEKGLNGFVPKFIEYTEIPGRDEAWLKEQLDVLGEQKFNQEVLCKFLGSSSTLIRGDVISKMAPDTVIYRNEGLDIYKKPEKDRVYMLTADVAGGTQNDSSAFIVYDITETPYRIVAKYKSNTISQYLFPNYIYEVAVNYNNAYVLIETNNNPNVAYIVHNELEYENLLYVSQHPQRGTELGAGFGGGQIKYGIEHNKKTKRIGCHSLKSMVESNTLIINDAETIAEISTFIESKSSPGTWAADIGYHDDLVMCLVAFAWATTNDYFAEMNDVNVRQAMYEEKMKQIEEELCPFGFIDDGRDIEGFNDSMSLARSSIKDRTTDDYGVMSSNLFTKEKVKAPKILMK